MLEVGRVCVKLAGREAGKRCVVVKKVDKNFVMIDGDVKRRKCNVDHLLPLAQVLDIKVSAKSEDVKAVLIKAGLMGKPIKKKYKPRERKKALKPKKVHKKREKLKLVKKPAPAAKKSAKKPAAKKPAKKSSSKKTK